MNQTLHPNPNIKAIKITLKDPRFFKTVCRARYRTGQLFFDDNEQLKLISTIKYHPPWYVVGLYHPLLKALKKPLLRS